MILGSLLLQNAHNETRCTRLSATAIAGIREAKWNAILLCNVCADPNKLIAKPAPKKQLADLNAKRQKK